jgi:hypothetical protein
MAGTTAQSARLRRPGSTRPDEREWKSPLNGRRRILIIQYENMTVQNATSPPIVESKASQMYIYRRALPIPTPPGSNAECTSARRGTMAYVRWDLFFHVSPKKREIKNIPIRSGRYQGPASRARQIRSRRRRWPARVWCVVWYLFSFPCPFVATPHAHQNRKDC